MNRESQTVPSFADFGEPAMPQIENAREMFNRGESRTAVALYLARFGMSSTQADREIEKMLAGRDDLQLTEEPMESPVTPLPATIAEAKIEVANIELADDAEPADQSAASTQVKTTHQAQKQRSEGAYLKIAGGLVLGAIGLGTTLNTAANGGTAFWGLILFGIVLVVRGITSLGSRSSSKELFKAGY